jgi:glycosyltransferase involved in cell wall biosynthesis
MKYPFIIFYRNDYYSYLDKFFIENNSKLNCTVQITNKAEKANKIYSANYHLLITLDETISDFKEQMCKEPMYKWIKLTTDDFTNVDTFNELVNKRFISNCALDRSYLRPVFSIFTSAFNSFEKIIRAYNSIKKQTLMNWEWVIIDDSPDDKHFQFLKTNLSHDSRIRMYRRSENSGSIGNVKNEAVSLCRGKYVLEMDHDDEILETVLEDAGKVFVSGATESDTNEATDKSDTNDNEDIGFVYMDFINVYENGDNFRYGDNICKGYGSYYCQKYNDKWVYVYNTPNINNITLSLLVCCPNHPRIWRRDLLLKIGNYCEHLPICDDYEILLRTAINTKIAKLPTLGYVQYMNNSNNNFSLIRNGEINRIGPQYISPIYYDEYKINDKMIELDAYEDPLAADTINNINIWKRDQSNYKHKYCNLLVNLDYTCQICIIGLDSLILNLEQIKELYKDSTIDFILLDNKCSNEYLWKQLDSYGFDRMKCYSLIDVSSDLLVSYFKTMYLSTIKFEIIQNGYINRPTYNTNMSQRSQIINSLTKPNDVYLEIGVEYGQTFLQTHFKDKTGVDPDPKFKVNDQGFKFESCTSDEFFVNQGINSESIKYDVIFIDGMHQSEYFLRDFNNSINVIKDGGSLFIDDILPLSYNEQLKIPRKHYYEKGILKYGEEWTGDIWKVVYHILKKYSRLISEFRYFYNSNYRGIAYIKIKESFEILESETDVINGYDYFIDFPKYLTLLALSK